MLPTLRPGLLRGIVGAVALGLGAAITYRSIALGGIFLVSALALMIMGLLLGGVRGLFLGMVFNIAAYVLLHYPIPPATAEFGTLLLAIALYVGIVPIVFVALGFVLKGVLGAALAAVLVVPAYITFLIPFPLGAGAGPVEGTALLFGGFAMTLGFLWGVGFASPGASAHEGPGYTAALVAAERPRPQPVREVVLFAEKQIPFVREHIVPLIRPILIAVGVVALLVGAVMFVAMNPIVPVGSAQTRDTAASALAVTGEKFILFVIIAVVVIGAVVGLALALSLGIRILNRQVVEAKQAAPEPVEPRQFRSAFKFVDFFVRWLQDLVAGVGRLFAR
ncbi:MAG: hypothetical protein IT323_13985 [Anaerolineae bacterium]|nr:hypothetical protein [Anaerolineae bacterium]